MKNVLLYIFLLFASGIMAQEKYEPNWKSLDQRPIPKWFVDAKFGIFVHWGVYSVPAWAPNTGDVYSRYAEWYWYRIDPQDKDGEEFRRFHLEKYGKNFHYQDFVSDFTAELFDADRWADIMKGSGANYVVLTSKHHEGFTLWPSAQSVNWNSFDVGPHRDICGELSMAVRKKGMRMGFYYSLYEWNHPLYHTDVNRYVDEHVLPQLKDITLQYKPEILWADGEWEHVSETWKSEAFLAWLFNESPVRNTVVVNDRWGKETRGKHGSFYTTEYDLVHDVNSKNIHFTHPWEECRGIAGSFGYNRNENLEDFSTTKELIHTLIDKVSRGGNLLLNIGPTADGRIPVIMQERLSGIGEWLRVNGEAIYGTRQCDTDSIKADQPFIRFTRKGHDLYVVFLEWNNNPVTISGIQSPTRASLLGFDNKEISYQCNNSSIRIELPSLNINELPCLNAWVLRLDNALK